MRCERCLRPIQNAEKKDFSCSYCVNTEWKEIKRLHLNEQNPRKMPRNEMKKLVKSIEEYGFVDPVIVNIHPERKNIVIGGHQRIKAAEKIGLKSVPVSFVNLPRDKEHVLNIGLNKISGDWDDEKLSVLLREISENEDPTLSGFEEHEIQVIVQDEERTTKKLNEDVIPDTAKSRVQEGDVWQLGEHKLICGDSLSPQTYTELLKDEVADLVWTDPPYGVSYKESNNTGKDWGVMDNDDLREDELQVFLKTIFSHCKKHTTETAALYSCYASRNHQEFEKALKQAGWKVKQMLVWSKGHVLGRSDYHWCHEPILYCSKEERSTEWFGDRKQRTVILNTSWNELQDLKKDELLKILQTIKADSDVLDIKKDDVNSYIHATQKPVELSRRMIQNSTRPGMTVLEPCAGSGSTLIACEDLKRNCRAIELDPKKCDLIITRYENYSGQKAKKL